MDRPIARQLLQDVQTGLALTVTDARPTLPYLDYIS